jgi:hypothetical protein
LLSPSYRKFAGHGHQYVAKSASAPARQLFDHVFGEDTATGERRAVFHELEKGVLSLGADYGHVREINRQLSSLKILTCLPRDPLQLGVPRWNELAFHQQRPFAGRVDD